MRETDKEIYGVLKMNLNPCTEYVSYLHALKFWKAVEEKYQQRKRQWVEANARMVAAKLAAIRARKELEHAKRVSDGGPLVGAESGEGAQSDDDFEDARDEEFSDVESDMFSDPGARYYSSLDADKWDQIRNNIMNIHRSADTLLEQKRRTFIRRVLVATLVAFWFFVAGLIFMFKTSSDTHGDEPLHEPATACRLHCDQKTVFDELVKTLFPPNNVEEI